jgi:hypothetical protein
MGRGNSRVKPWSHSQLSAEVPDHLCPDDIFPVRSGLTLVRKRHLITYGLPRVLRLLRSPDARFNETCGSLAGLSPPEAIARHLEMFVQPRGAS